MPELVCEDSDFLRRDLVGRPEAMRATVSLVFFLRLQVSMVGVLVLLPGCLMARQVIFLAVPLGCRIVRVSRLVAALSGYLL